MTISAKLIKSSMEEILIDQSRGFAATSQVVPLQPLVGIGSLERYTLCSVSRVELHHLVMSKPNCHICRVSFVNKASTFTQTKLRALKVSIGQNACSFHPLFGFETSVFQSISCTIVVPSLQQENVSRFQITVNSFPSSRDNKVEGRVADVVRFIP